MYMETSKIRVTYYIVNFFVQTWRRPIMHRLCFVVIVIVIVVVVVVIAQVFILSNSLTFVPTALLFLFPFFYDVRHLLPFWRPSAGFGNSLLALFWSFGLGFSPAIVVEALCNRDLRVVDPYAAGPPPSLDDIF